MIFQFKSKLDLDGFESARAQAYVTAAASKVQYQATQHANIASNLLASNVNRAKQLLLATLPPGCKQTAQFNRFVPFASCNVSPIELVQLKKNPEIVFVDRPEAGMVEAANVTP